MTLEKDDEDIQIIIRARRLLEPAIEAARVTSDGTKLTDLQLAKKLGIAQGSFSLYKRGFFINSQVGQFAKLLKGLDLDPTTFLKDVGIY